MRLIVGTNCFTAEGTPFVHGGYLTKRGTPAPGTLLNWTKQPLGHRIHPLHWMKQGDRYENIIPPIWDTQAQERASAAAIIARWRRKGKDSSIIRPPKDRVKRGKGLPKVRIYTANDWNYDY